MCGATITAKAQNNDNTEKPKKALLVVDIQKWLTEHNLHDFPIFIQTVNQTISTFRESGDLIIFVQHNNVILRKNTDNWEIDDRVDKQDGDIVVQKFQGNAFAKTDLESIIRENNIDEIVVCGLISHGCVKATCLGSLKLGFPTALVKNGHSNWHKKAVDKINLVEKELVDKGATIFSLDK